MTSVLKKELTKRNIPFEQQKKLQLYYDKVALKKYFIADFVCYGKIIIEIKSVNFIHDSAKRQVINYLKATNYQLGLLINFGESSLKWNRIINTPNG